MNKLIMKYLIVLSTISIFLISCENDKVDYGYDKYYEEIVTAMGKNVFLLDDGKKILSTNENEKLNLQSGDRVLIHYTLLPETESGYDQVVRLNGASKIPQGKLKLVSEKDIKAAVKEPVHLESAWLGSHYLNLQMYMNRYSEAHTIGLLADSTQLSNDTLRIYFEHNPNNDSAGYPVHFFLSFDLENVLGKPENTKNIAVNINTDNYGTKIYELKY
jgi:hypothetical protein